MKIKAKQIADRYLGYALIAFFLPLAKLLGALLNRNHKLDNASAPHNILFIKLLGLGSLVVAIDSIAAIKKKYPNARLILITDSNIARGIIPFKMFDEVWQVPSVGFMAMLSAAIKYLLKSWQLKKLWVVDLEVYSKLTTVFSLFTRGINRFGFHLFPVAFRRHMNTHQVYFNQFVSLHDNYIKMCEAVTTEKYVGQEGSLHLFNAQRVNESTMPYIAVNNTCSDLALVRQMTPALFKSVCDFILSHTHYGIVLPGAPSDEAANNQFIESSFDTGIRSRVINIAGKYDFEEYYRFLFEQVAFIISIDSAPLHIAHKLGLPTISVWGPTNPVSYFKIGAGERSRHLFYYMHMPCSPCVHHTVKLPCKGDNICMKQMQPEELNRMVAAMLERINVPMAKEFA